MNEFDAEVIKIEVIKTSVGSFARSILRYVELKCLSNDHGYFHFCSIASDFLTGPSLAVTAYGTGICTHM